MKSSKHGRREKPVIVNPDRFARRFKRTTWEPRGTFTLQVKMCAGCLHGQHERCDPRFVCSCICREDLRPELALQHAHMAYHGLI